MKFFKSKLFVGLLSLLLVVAFLPTTSFAADTPSVIIYSPDYYDEDGDVDETWESYDIYSGKDTGISAQAKSAVSYNKSTGTLTLTNYNYGPIILSNLSKVKIVLVGKNVVGCSFHGTSSQDKGIQCNQVGAIELTGSGSLSANLINHSGLITINGGNIKGSNIISNTLSINGGSINLTGSGGYACSMYANSLSIIGGTIHCTTIDPQFSPAIASGTRIKLGRVLESHGYKQGYTEGDWVFLDKYGNNPEDVYIYPDPTPVPGTVVTVGTSKYKVTKDKQEVSFVKGKNTKKVTIPKTVRIAGVTYKVTGIAPKAFAGKKTTTVIVKTKALTKSKIKKSLKGSKVKYIKVSVGSKSANKKTVKAYNKIFTKKNVGKKVTVK